MPENQVEIVIRAQDQASQPIRALQQRFAEIEQAGKRMGASLEGAGQRTLSVSRQFSALSASTRFAAASVLTELNPALGQAVTRMASLSTVAGTTGSLLKGSLVVVGIAIAAAALGDWIRRTNEQIEAQAKLNRQIGSFDVSGLRASIAQLSLDLEIQTKKNETFFGSFVHGLENMRRILTGTSTTTGELQKRLDAGREAFEKIRPQEFAARLAGLNAEQQKLIQNIHQTTIASSESIAEIEGAADALAESITLEAKLQSRRLEFDRVAAVQKARAAELGEQEVLRIEQDFAKQRETLTIEFSTRIVAARKQEKDRIKAIVEDAEREAQAAAEESTRQAGVRIDKMFEEARKQSANIERMMTTLGNAGADALFDAFLGRARNFGDVLRSLFEGLGRDLFRNTVTGFLGGQSHGLSLQTLMSLGGGGRPLGSGPKTASQVSAGFGFLPAPIPASTSSAGTTIPTAEVLRERGVAEAGTGALSFLGPIALAGTAASLQVGLLETLGISRKQAQLSLPLTLALGPLGIPAAIFLGLGARARAKRDAHDRDISTIVHDAALQAIESAQSPEDLEPANLGPLIRAFIGRELRGSSGDVITPDDNYFGFLAVIANKGGPGARAEVEQARQERLASEDFRPLGGFGIEDVFPSFSRLELLPGTGPRQQRLALSAVRRGALVSLLEAAGPEEMEMMINILRRHQELTGLPILPQARYLDLLA